ncbi:MAG: peptidylprolyl isomerase [Candidatus Omnitrophica bacterium]|nr:peptidylprolyl isomerase [Candidatus Omnitrophota bacterium]MDE2008621.1 peptidylprolyl isomerase [Candidatus Omnitrophota bacterium]MDE2214087.1 peptidylprolyl isomerase [Candidatus Omnitrophota bacterium]MDE2230935.1 peptidylprolyl isomerase [Candidatus Omnitrophota bacterium]
MESQVISFDYVLTAKAGEVVDASAKGKPLIFISGQGQIIPGLETILLAMQPLEKKTVTIAAKDAYGLYDAGLVYKVDRSRLPNREIKVGDMFEVGRAQDFSPVTITAINGDEITLDGNHPLAGQDLTFAVEIVAKRPATPEELAHGHVHGAGGCHH